MRENHQYLYQWPYCIVKIKFKMYLNLLKRGQFSNVKNSSIKTPFSSLYKLRNITEIHKKFNLK